MSFARPDWLVLAALLPLAALLLVWLVRRRRIHVAGRLGDPLLLERLGLGDARRWPWLRLLLLMLAAAALGLAAAGPQWGSETVAGRSEVRNVVLAVDVSRSMLARDVEPSRLERERLLARRLLRELQGDRFGLVAFAGRAYILSPLTVDHGALQLYIDALDPDIVSYGGSALSAAIRQATDLVRGERPGAAERAVVLITDGEALEQEQAVLQAAERAAELGVTVHTVGAGTTGGSLIPRVDPRTGQDRGFVVDEGGNRVVSRLDEELLRQVAASTGGQYFALDQPGSTERLVDALRDLTREEGERGDRRRRKDRSAWFIGFALLALLGDSLAERRTGRRAGVGPGWRPPFRPASQEEQPLRGPERMEPEPAGSPAGGEE